MKYLVVSIALLFSPLLHCQEISLLWAPTIPTSFAPEFKLSEYQLLGFGVIAGGNHWAKFIAKAQFYNSGVDISNISDTITADKLIAEGNVGSDFDATRAIYSVGLLADLEPNLFITGGLSFVHRRSYMKVECSWYKFKSAQSNSPFFDNLTYFAGFGIRIQRLRFLFIYEGKAQTFTSGIAFKF